MEENKIIALISTLAAGAVATVAVAMNWRKIHRAAGKAKNASLAHLKQLKATINPIRPQKPASALRKKPKKQTEELVANRISGEGNGKSRGGNGNGYRQKILDLFNQDQKGYTLQELSLNLGVTHIALVSSIKKLVNEGNLRKEGNLYLINRLDATVSTGVTDTKDKVPNEPKTPVVVQIAEAIAQNSSVNSPTITTQQPGESKLQ